MKSWNQHRQDVAKILSRFKRICRMGWRVPVVPEFKGITVGGAIQGAGIESSSHKEGQFNDACEFYEVLTGAGELLHVSRESNSDLFYGIAGSYGTIALILGVAIKIVPVQPWVELKYHAFTELKEALNQLKALAGKAEFLEGLIYKEDEIVIIEGNSKSKKDSELSTVYLNRPWSPWYYQHVKHRYKKTKREEIYLLDYLFRHDRGAFWMGAYALHWTLLLRYYLENRFCLKQFSHHLFQKGFFEKYFRIKDPGLIFRTFIGYSMGSRNLYKMLHAKSEQWFAEKFVVQDYYLPYSQTKNFLNYCMEQTQIFPLWLCPVKSTRKPQLFSPHFTTQDQLLVDVGVYGMPHKDLKNHQINEHLEAYMHELGGKKMLYSYNFYSKERFWQIYCEDHYQELRKKYRSDPFLTIDAKMGMIC